MMKRLLRVGAMIARIVLIGGLIAIITPFLIRIVVDLAFAHRTYTAEKVPARRVAIIFGAQALTLDYPSAMLADRVATGAALYHAGKVEVLLMTGDNRFVEYNEPETMRRYAMGLGVPDSAIVLDYAGRRTYDSCYRAKAIFGVTEAIVITQQFHLDRAMMLCSALGVDAIGVAADYQRPEGYRRRLMVYLTAREFAATSLAVLDIIRRPEPVLGEPLPIFGTDARP